MAAIGPQDIVRRPLTQEESQILAKLEEEINGYLDFNYTGSGMVSFPLGQRTLSPRIKAEVVGRYKAAGWAEVEFDFSHDGSSIDFYDKKRQ
jgi:hypothetical protein